MKTGGSPGMAPVPGTRSVHQGHRLQDEIRVPAPGRCGRRRSADDAAAALIASIWPVIGGGGYGVTGRAARRGRAGPGLALISCPRGREGLQAKRGFACTSTRHFSPVCVVLR